MPLSFQTLQRALDANSKGIVNLGTPTSATDATQVTSTLADIKAVGTAASLGSSFKAAPADHVHAIVASTVVKSGTATLDFGSAPGTNVATAVVTGQTAIVSGSVIDAFLMGDSTATHNAYEHAVAPIRFTCGSIVAGTGFTITAVTDWRLTGTFTVHWTWT